MHQVLLYMEIMKMRKDRNRIGNPISPYALSKYMDELCEIVF